MPEAREAALLQPDEVALAQAVGARLQEGLNQTLLGQEALTRLTLVGCLARGHVLLDGLPGLGKTELVKALAALLGLQFSRVQFTADLLPGDITGGHVLEDVESPDLRQPDPNLGWDGSQGEHGGGAARRAASEPSGELAEARRGASRGERRPAGAEPPGDAGEARTRSRRRAFVFHQGPIFANIVLADEINRASPKTQSALLEAMQERRVTVLGETRPLPDPFWVLATQNPVELEGTWPLPEAQLDRFLFKLDVRRVGSEVLERILLERRAGRPPEHTAALSPDELARLFAAVERVFLPRPVAGLIARLVEATHPDSREAPKLVRNMVRWGASPRAAIAIAEAARAHALLSGKPHVGFDDVRAVAPHALAHRVVVDYRGRLEGVDGHAIASEVLAAAADLGGAR